MLGVLGIFKARGTKAFNEAIGKTSQIAGGSITSMLAIKCLLQTQVYGPYIVNMLLPPGAAILILIIMFPTTLLRRAQEKWLRKGDESMRMRREETKLAIEDGKAEFEPPRWEPVLNFGKRCCSVPYKTSLAVPCLRKAATEEYIDQIKRRQEGIHPAAPLVRWRENLLTLALNGISYLLIRLTTHKCFLFSFFLTYYSNDQRLISTPAL